MPGHDDAARRRRSARLRAGGSPAGAAPVPGRAAPAGGYLYWSNTIGRILKPGDGVIGRARLDGTGVSQKFITGASLPAMVLVYRGYLYWTNFVPLRNGAGTIGRARLNGTRVSQRFIRGASFPDAIAAGSRYLYWTNQSSGTIGRARLNGTDVNQRFVARRAFLSLHGVAAGPGRW
jgi:Low-density lipoprotein receptor repeat class B